MSRGDSPVKNCKALSFRFVNKITIAAVDAYIQAFNIIIITVGITGISKQILSPGTKVIIAGQEERTSMAHKAH